MKRIICKIIAVALLVVSLSVIGCNYETFSDVTYNETDYRDDNVATED